MAARLDPALAADRAREAAAAKAAAIKRIGVLTARVPPKVLGGGALQAVEWRRAAVHAVSLTRRQRVSIDQLRDAVTILEQYE